jgi:hypothetical protein
MVINLNNPLPLSFNEVKRTVRDQICGELLATEKYRFADKIQMAEVVRDTAAAIFENMELILSASKRAKC